MRTTPALLILAGLLAGCAAWNKQYTTDYYPGEGTLTYRAGFGVNEYPPDDPDAEAMRQGWIDELIAENDFCPGGYDVVERRVVWLHPGRYGDIWYTIACRP
jgi:hypothetical protein